MRIKSLFFILSLPSLVEIPEVVLFREFKSEYKQKFRPFSQYEYCGDGKFVNTSVSPPSETAVDSGHREISRLYSRIEAFCAWKPPILMP